MAGYIHIARQFCKIRHIVVPTDTAHRKLNLKKKKRKRIRAWPSEILV